MYLEPAFVEVYDSIDDVYIKNLFIIERDKLAGGGTLLTTAFTPWFTHTAHLSYEETIKFYENLLIKVKHDLEKEKQKPNFDDLEYYKRRKKELVVENFSNTGVQRRSR